VVCSEAKVSFPRLYRCASHSRLRSSTSRCTIQPCGILRACSACWSQSSIPSEDSSWLAGSLGWYVFLHLSNASLYKFLRLGQVLGLFIVGLGEYGVVWLATDWNKEVQRSKDRNLLEAKQQAFCVRNEDNVG